MRIIVDAMGGDNAPEAIVNGCILARDEYNVNIVLSGKEDLLKQNIEKYTNDFSNLDILNADDVITNDDKPVKAIRRKKESSLVKALYAVKNNDADAIVSAGSTGALLTGATVIIGRVGGLERPALAPFIPTAKGYSLLVDAGANVDCKPEFLYDFAEMGSIYIKNFMNIDNPRVGLLNIGAEKGKGNKLTNDAYSMLENSNLNFVGNIEGRYALDGAIDVIVADGFAGNVMLKSIEGTASFIMSSLKEELTSTFISKVGALLTKPSLRKFKKRFDYGEYGGAMLLGVNAPVIKAHGSSDSIAIKNAIKQSKTILDSSIVDLIRESISRR
ncbi:phosphate acyltransferase PlsX [Sedimentibacter sp. zth1]|uniref:phosphate acyltransferase PlsX n=1 Tax=Sedimentibacter sp. zth1 TaxID=2816908 RepID=UPI001A92A73B|nr:phosphate acyltransferase PlsX [Sedimentibacter sp. zth1]QSX06597.1 phosphate acyltransferase PlsX [Sedimentibacter sp. zth1]